MRIEGTWLLCDDGVRRPIFLVEVLGSHGKWVEVPLLADCGADRTVLSYAAFAGLGFVVRKGQERVSGIGGTADPVVFDTQIRIPRSDGVAVTFRGQFVAILEASALDISLLGRDVTNHFTLVVDNPGNTVCLLSHGEVYHA